jgi:riboflavin biosynthesis pyrimidine reductase
VNSTSCLWVSVWTAGLFPTGSGHQDHKVSTASLLRLHPGPVEPTTVADCYLIERPPAELRPWLAVCMIASIDGATAVSGRSGGLANATDRQVLLTIRTAADVVLVGAGTAAGEGYRAPRQSGLRIGVVTNSGRVDTTRELFTSGAGFLIAPESASIPADVEVLRVGAHRVDLGGAVARMGEIVPGVTFVSAEGGPRLNAALLDADLVDEVSVTTSPRLVGGPSGRLAMGAAEVDRRFELAHLLLDAEHFVFSRWVRTPA